MSTESDQEKFDRIYCNVEDEYRTAWEGAFGADSRARPFRPDSVAILAEAQRRMAVLGEPKSSAPIVTDLQIILMLVGRFGMSRSEAIARLAKFDFKKMEESHD